MGFIDRWCWETQRMAVPANFGTDWRVWDQVAKITERKAVDDRNPACLYIPKPYE